MVKIRPCGRVFLCQRKKEIKLNPLVTTTSLFFISYQCWSVVFVVFQFNVTLNDIQSPQLDGGTFMSINPKPGGKWYFSFSLTLKPANIVVLRFPGHLFAKKLSYLYVTPFDIFLWFLNQNLVNTVAPHSSLSLGPGDGERWDSALFTGWIESTNSKIKLYAFSSDPFWTECWCLIFIFSLL